MAGELLALRRYTAMHTTTNGQQGERGDPMKVLAFIVALALLVTPLAAAAPSLTTVHRIGFLWNSSPSFTHYLLEAFRHGLQEHGYVEGQHFTIESPCGGLKPLPGLAAELEAVRKHPDLIA